MRFVRRIAVVFVLLFPGAAGAKEPLPLCRELTFETLPYVVCTLNPAHHVITMERNTVPGPASAIVAAMLGRKDAPEVIMNGGMYDHALQPIGLYVENGGTIKKISTKPGRGNFHMLPNGVFHVRGPHAGVQETRAFIAANTTPDFATQSGPMLVIGGAVHPRFQTDGESLKIRNGVGVTRSGAVMFALSRKPVSFGAFARLFRESLHCPDALYLDGTISVLYAKGLGVFGGLFPVGPLIVVKRKP